MAGVKKATAAAGAEESVKAENNTTKNEKIVSGEDNAATEGEEKKEDKETVTLAYIGPSLPAGLLKTNKILIGTTEEIKKELARVLEKYPLVEKMLVPVEKLAEKKSKAATAGNILNKYYTDLVSTIAAHEKKEG